MKDFIQKLWKRKSALTQDWLFPSRNRQLIANVAFNIIKEAAYIDMYSNKTQ